MRLIDADKIKQSVTNEMFKAELNSPVYCTLECVIADINEQPIAYDIDKVVKKLKEINEDENICEKFKDRDRRHCKNVKGCFDCAIREAIGVVKSCKT